MFSLTLSFWFFFYLFLYYSSLSLISFSIFFCFISCIGLVVHVVAVFVCVCRLVCFCLCICIYVALVVCPFNYLFGALPCLSVFHIDAIRQLSCGSGISLLIEVQYRWELGSPQCRPCEFVEPRMQMLVLFYVLFSVLYILSQFTVCSYIYTHSFVCVFRALVGHSLQMCVCVLFFNISELQDILQGLG